MGTAELSLIPLKGHDEDTAKKGHDEDTAKKGHDEDTAKKGHNEDTAKKGHDEDTAKEGNAGSVEARTNNDRHPTVRLQGGRDKHSTGANSTIRMPKEGKTIGT